MDGEETKNVAECIRIEIKNKILTSRGKPRHKTKSNMIIKNIQLQNFQTIKEFNGDFEGNVYFITGENELGKSTLLKAIMVLLTGNRDEVLRNGEEKGFAKIVVGGDGKNYEVELRMTKANPRGTITIKSLDTGMKSDRVTALQEIFGYQDFDANEFVSWSETAEGRRKQVQIVKSLLPEETQKRIADIDTEVIRIKEERKEDNATLKTFTTIFNKAEKSISPEDVEKYSQPLDMQELLEQQKEAVQLEEQAKTVRTKLAEREKTIAETPQKLADLEEKQKELIKKEQDLKVQAEQARKNDIERAEQVYKQALADIEATYNKSLTALEETAKAREKQYKEEKKAIQAAEQDAIKRRNNCKQWLEDYEYCQPTDINQQIADVQHHNEMNRKVTEYLTAKKNKEDAADKVAKHEKKLSDLSTERETLVKSAKLPISGLNFTEDGLELNGIPFVAGKVSDSQIMEVAAKLIIAKNPTVKVFRIARGESLGKKKLEALINLAKENGYQGFIEQVVREQNELRVEQYNEI